MDQDSSASQWTKHRCVETNTQANIHILLLQYKHRHTMIQLTEFLWHIHLNNLEHKLKFKLLTYVISLHFPFYVYTLKKQKNETIQIRCNTYYNKPAKQ